MKHLLHYGRLVLVTYLVIMLLLMIFEERLIFMPSGPRAGDWNPVGIPFEDVHFTAPDGPHLHGWFCEAENPRAVVLFCHGNAGNITNRVEVARRLLLLRASVLLFDYRGYGRSTGKPSEQGVLTDARTARTWLAQRTGMDESQIVLMGRSLGGAVAIDLAAADGARGLIVESSFTSLPDVAAVHYPWIPVRRLMRSRLESVKKIGNYRGPVLLCHGDCDEIIPFEHGKLLYEACTYDDKEFLAIPNGSHNEMPPREYYLRLNEFLGRL